VQHGEGAAPEKAATPGPAKANGHRLLCADLRGGKHIWEQDITGDVISAPVIDVQKDHVLFTCFDGTSFCLDANTGSVLWKKANAGTSAPLIADGDVVLTEKRVGGPSTQPTEGLRRYDAKGQAKDQELIAEERATYFRPGAEGNVALANAQLKALDTAVGFGGAAAIPHMDVLAYPANWPSLATQPASTQPAQHLNVSTVAGGWAYQGSKPVARGGRIFNAQSNYFNCVSSADGSVQWRARATGKGINADHQAFSPPALGKQNMYVCSAGGHLVCLDQKSGGVKFMYALSKPLAFQPALAEGAVFIGTADGHVLCVQTGDKDASDWHAWGGNAQHNKN
jgi:eukaryotic-like serine/threonine-protein kinase